MKKYNNLPSFVLSFVIAGSMIFALLISNAHSQVLKADSLTHKDFIELLQNSDPVFVEDFLVKVDKQWQDSWIPMVLESINFASSSYVSNRLNKILIKKVGKDYGGLHGWYEKIWNKPELISSDYSEFKASLYRLIDPRFETYFRDRQSSARIRLDEIRWGGVAQDGIPPLRNPQMLSADEADYLEDDNIVFGVDIDGDVRAYPKRILAWHEMFVDTFYENGDTNGKSQAIAGVYCTLCGTVIIYKTEHDGVAHELGTSGFLYRSNKLMYDKATQSMWSTTRGEPVLGPLVDKGIALEHLSVVTTTWKEWKRRHPKTKVLSLNTGHSRDYGEGVAYNEYFSTDRLMFNTPFNDKRLKNKREVLALRFAAAPNEQLAIDTHFLNKNPVYSDKIGQQKFLVLTDKSGANRVFDPKDVVITDYDGFDTATDSKGNQWQVGERELSTENGQRLSRLPYHRAFWFGWRAAFPDTKLIKR